MNAKEGHGIRLAGSILACLVWGLVFFIPLIGIALLFLWDRNVACNSRRD